MMFSTVNIEPKSPPQMPQRMAGMRANTCGFTAYVTSYSTVELAKEPSSFSVSDQPSKVELSRFAVKTDIMQPKKIIQPSRWFQNEATCAPPWLVTLNLSNQELYNTHGVHDVDQARGDCSCTHLLHGEEQAAHGRSERRGHASRHT